MKSQVSNSNYLRSQHQHLLEQESPDRFQVPVKVADLISELSQIKVSKRLFIGLLLLLLAFSLRAQQDPMYSQYMFNGLAINPAYAGSKDYFAASLLHRNQWVGIDGAPTTTTLSMHSPLKNANSAVGGMLLHDKIGVTSQTDAFASYAYRIQLGKEARLAFGLRAGVSQYKWDPTRIIYWQSGNDLGIRQGVAPNVGSGMYFQTRQFYLGVSVPRMISYHPDELFSNNIENVPTSRRHYFATTGYAFEANENLVIKPSVLVKYEKAAPTQFDLNLNILLAKKVWVGASYRSGDAIVGMVEVLPTPRIQIGYAYDHTLSELGNYNSGSHELILTYNFGPKVIKLKTPRYF